MVVRERDKSGLAMPFFSKQSRIRARKAFAALPLLLCAACHDEAAEKTAVRPAQPVEVTLAKEVSWPDRVTVPATVSAVDTAVLASRAGGWVTRVEVEAGAHVEKGAPLAEVGMSDARGRLADAEARVTAAKASFDEASANERRYRVLNRTHAASERQYDEAERALATAKAELSAANAALTVAKSNLDYSEIRAPFAGMIVEKKVSPGDFAAAGAALFVIAGTIPEIRAQVGPKTFAALKLGDEAEIAISGKRQPATITRLVDAADPAARTHLVELHLKDGAAAAYGAYAELSLTLGAARQLAVPATALTRRAGLAGVFVVDAENRAHFRLVRAGEERDGKIAIAAGLVSGERVVAAPAANLENDVAVKPIATAPVSLRADAPRG
jgi:RND family efflux transporter MFP subunit